MDHVLTHARDESQEGEDDDDGQGPLNLGGEITEPKNAEDDDRRRRDRAEGQPGQPIFVRQTMANFRGGVHEFARSINRAMG